MPMASTVIARGQLCKSSFTFHALPAKLHDRACPVDHFTNLVTSAIPVSLKKRSEMRK